MINFEIDKDLTKYNTFGIEHRARKFISINNVSQIIDISNNFFYKDLFILGGGSNILLTKDIDKIVLKIDILGKDILEKKEEEVLIKVNSGEVWHDFVIWCVEKDFGGIENLAFIPGSVGASPIQNIGAYGVEVKDVIERVNVYDLLENREKVFLNSECNFGYRDSIFKKEKDRYLVLSVVFRLTKKKHKINISYGEIKERLPSIFNIKDISKIVMEIRKNKLPNPLEMGNGGSFYKNPIVSKDVYYNLKRNFSDIKSFEQNDGSFKISAGWLIENIGFKGKSFGKCGVYEKQALILVNYGGSKGEEIVKMSQIIQNKIFQKFRIIIEPEINIY